MLGRLKRRVREQRGQTLVEFALILPILLVVVLGIVDFGRAVNYWNGETSMANDLARIVSVGTWPTSGPCTGSETSFNAYVSCALTNQYGINTVSSGSNGLSGVTACVSAPTPTTPGTPVTVKISGSYGWLPIFKFSTAATITGSATIPLVNAITASTMNTQTAAC